MRKILVISTLFFISVFAQNSTYKPGVTYQAANPNYPERNPFYFEGRIDWDLLRIDTPANAWEYAQRGIHKQDDLEDVRGAIEDYRKSISLNNLENGTCQLITTATPGFGQNTKPPPCMFTVRLRLGNLLKDTKPEEAINLFRQVLEIDPLHLGVNTFIGETYAHIGENEKAVEAYKAELALSPVTDLSKKLTGDKANNARAHWALAGLYEKLGAYATAVDELDLYLKATKWHSDTYPWRIDLARKRIEKLQNR